MSASMSASMSDPKMLITCLIPTGYA
jgi:hypothetical protein